MHVAAKDERESIRDFLKTNPREAVDRAANYLSLHPNEPNALFFLAIGKRLLGEVDESLTLLSDIIRKTPGQGMVHFERALTRLAAGDVHGAVADAYETVKVQPHFAQAWHLLSEQQFRLGNEDQAEAAHKRYISLISNTEDMANAAMHLYDGNLAKAEEISRAHLKKHPTDVTAIRILADVGIQVGAYEDAENLLIRCLELSPDFDLARLSYAALLGKRHRFQEALEQIEKLLCKDKDNPSYLVQKATILVSIGLFDEAILLFQSLAARLPLQSKIQMSLGHTLKTVGRQEEAIKAYRVAVKLEPGLGEAYWSLANLKTFKFTDEDIEQMQKALAAERPMAQDFFHLCFALGAALEGRRDFLGAFEAYRKGNMVKRNLVRYDADENRQETEKLISFFRPAYFESTAGSGEDSDDPIFIVGLPRAGSTLLEQILASHSQVEGTLELPDIISIARRLSGKTSISDESAYPQILADLAPDQLRELGQEYMERTRIHRTGKRYFIDKMPNNFAHIGLIHSILPQAKIIDARRHPMANCFSGFKQLFAKGQNFTYSLEDIGRYYCDYVDLMDHWDTVLPGRVLRVQYEDVLADIDQQVHRILDYCGLEFEESCLRFYETDRAVRTASSEQVRRPLYQGAKEQWRNFAGELAPLQQVLAPVLARHS
ncbi:sulfotransferase [Paremcibacter congregatus]|uniref:tetratricopeptide repeat-containing sulfotransferase family protein n=1 Tax=Paremcibacter congregatus TaxID=2043170 RepID=UPI003A9325CD